MSDLANKPLPTTEMRFIPCVGCGYCCLKVMCDLGRDLHGKLEERCPWLDWNGERYLCALGQDPKAVEALAMGEGCSSSLNTWRRDVRYRG